MKIIYLDCSMGAAGDMLAAALLSLHPAPETALDKIRAMALPGVTVELLPAESRGLAGWRYEVSVGGEDEEEGRSHPYHGRHLGDVESLIRAGGLDEAVCEDAIGVYRLLAEAESAVHGEPVGHVHFHEVGSLDAIADICTVCLLLHELAPDEKIGRASCRERV